MKLLLLLLSIGLCLLGCASSTQKDAGDTDTTAAETMRPRPSPSIAPGTAKVTALVQRYEAQDNHYVCTLKIEEVAAYGAGTPALPVGTEIDVVVSKALFKDDPDGSKAAAMLAIGHAVSITLKHLTAATAGEAPPAPSWRAVTIE